MRSSGGRLRRLSGVCGILCEYTGLIAQQGDMKSRKILATGGQEVIVLLLLLFLHKASIKNNGDKFWG